MTFRSFRCCASVGTDFRVSEFAAGKPVTVRLRYHCKEQPRKTTFECLGAFPLFEKGTGHSRVVYVWTNKQHLKEEQAEVTLVWHSVLYSSLVFGSRIYKTNCSGLPFHKRPQYCTKSTFFWELDNYQISNVRSCELENWRGTNVQFTPFSVPKQLYTSIVISSSRVLIFQW